jgi:hypothetical protein
MITILWKAIGVDIAFSGEPKDSLIVFKERSNFSVCKSILDRECLPFGAIKAAGYRGSYIYRFSGIRISWYGKKWFENS